MSRRRLGIALLATLLLGVAAGSAFAEDPVGEQDKPAAGAEAEQALPFGGLEERLQKSPGVFWFVTVTRYGALLVGLVLLVLLYLRYDKIRGGIRAAPPRTPPTEVFEPFIAALVGIGGLFVLPTLVAKIIMEQVGRESFTTVYQLIVMGACTLPVAVLVVVRRRRMAAATPLRWPKPLGYGLGTYCLATVFVIPLMLVTVLVLEAMGQPAPVQELVQKSLESKDDTLPLAIAFFGVFVAPLAEEAIFRGLLYPALKRWGGGTRSAAISSAIMVSALFAVVHGSATAFASLFALAMVLTFVYERTNSLATVVVAHATNNLLSLAPLLLLRYAA